MFSIVEMLARALLLGACLRIENNRFTQSGVYRLADRSEKSGISYSLGQTFAHLFVTRRIGVPYTLHVDRYWEEVDLVWGENAKRRPDLIGRGAMWVVIEAKGRTWGFDQTVMDNAREQKLTVLTIGGATPGLFLAAVAHFAYGVLVLRVRDPEPASDPTRLPADAAAFIRTYYQPFLEATQSGARRQLFGRTVRFVRFPGLDLEVGLEEAVIKALRRSDAALLREADRFASEAQAREQSDELRAIGADGVAFWLGPSWSEDVMTLEPWDRAAKWEKGSSSRGG